VTILLQYRNIKAVIANCNYRLKTFKKQPQISPKSPQVVKYEIKGEKRACPTPNAGKNRPFVISLKARFHEELLENKRKLAVRYEP
jgi:hypothetical protein